MRPRRVRVELTPAQISALQGAIAYATAGEEEELRQAFGSLAGARAAENASIRLAAAMREATR